MKYQQKNFKIQLTPKELKGIMSEYTPTEEDMLNDDDRLYKAKRIIREALEESDYIIYILYLHYQSERKLAQILNVSRTPIHRTIEEIKTKIRDYKNGLG